MTFDVIPIFFFFWMGQRITSTSGRPQKKKLELRRRTFSMLIFLGAEKVVDVNHLRSSMLIFLLLVPHPVYYYWRKSFDDWYVFGVRWNFYSFQLNFYLDFKITKNHWKGFFFFYYLFSCQFFLFCFCFSIAVLFLLGFNLSFHNDDLWKCRKSI
jgi:hypothetical protein